MISTPQPLTQDYGQSASYGALMQQDARGTEAQSPQNLAMSQEEIANVREIIQQYSNYPGVSQAFAAMVTANSQNPEHLATLVREMVEQIEQVQANPHMRTPVNPAIAQAMKAIREAELQKPDPLNLLRGDEKDKEQKPETTPLTLASLIGVAAEPRQTVTTPSFGNLMWGEQAQTQQRGGQANPLAEALAGTNAAKEFLAALSNNAPSEQRGQTGQSPERDGWSR